MQDIISQPSPLARRTVSERMEADDILTSSVERELRQAPTFERTAAFLGPIQVVHAYWLAGMSCDGCTVTVTGATAPGIVDLLTGRLPGIPRLVLHHPVTSMESGEEFIKNYQLAAQGKLDAPYVVIYEGSIANESLVEATGGFWAGMGVEIVDGEPKQIPTTTWLRRMAPRAAAVIAIGTCATWGGIPSAYGNPTGSMSVMDFLGKDYLSALGLPVINVPGCAPIGDDFTEAVVTLLLFLNGYGPLPEFDELGRPAWQFEDTVHRHCPRAGFYEEGVFAHEYGGKECLVEIGCWGPVVQCRISERGAVDHKGGCMNTGGVCIGCMMPGFPDRFAPFYKKPPGTTVSSSASRIYGQFIRALRGITQQYGNRETRWDRTHEVPSGWGHVNEPDIAKKLLHDIYERLQFHKSERPGRTKPEEGYPSGYETPAERAGESKPPEAR